MAQSPFLDVSSEFQPELTDIQRKQRLAQMLTQQGMQAPQGQVVSGRYVAPSIAQNIANLFSVYSGQNLGKETEARQQDLARAIRQQGTKEATGIVEALTGTPAQQQILGNQIPESMLPRGQTAVTDEGDATLVQAARAAQSPNARLALARALSAETPTGRALLPSVMERAMPKDFDLTEGQVRFRINPETGKPEQIAAGTEKFRAPLQVDTGTSIEFRDAKDPSKLLQVIPKSQAGQVVEREDGTYLVDTRTGQARPVMGQQGQPLVGGKPLTENQGKATAFGIRAVESNKILKDIEDSGTRTTGGFRTVVAGTLGAIPLVGENLSDTAKSALNFTASNKQQQTDQARRNFITAVLRKESGAVISPSEFANEEKKYFPQIGDGEKVIKQKQEARDLAIKALEVEAGPTGARSIKAQQNLQLTPQDQEALNWANSNPNDPRSSQIKQRLGR